MTNEVTGQSAILFIIGKSAYYIKVFFGLGQEKNHVNQPIFASGNPAEYKGPKTALLLQKSALNPNNRLSFILNHLQPVPPFLMLKSSNLCPTSF